MAQLVVWPTNILSRSGSLSSLASRRHYGCILRMRRAVCLDASSGAVGEIECSLSQPGRGMLQAWKFWICGQQVGIGFISWHHGNQVPRHAVHGINDFCMHASGTGYGTVYCRCCRYCTAIITGSHQSSSHHVRPAGWVEPMVRFQPMKDRYS